MLDHAVTLSPSETGSDEFVPRSRIQINFLFIAAPAFLYAFCDRLRIPLEFRCGFGSFLSHFVRVLLVIVAGASHQAESGGENAEKNDTKPEAG
jgi:hypothetical protein